MRWVSNRVGGKDVSLVRASVSTFEGVEKGGGRGGFAWYEKEWEGGIYYLGYRQRFVGIDYALQASVGGFAR